MLETFSLIGFGAAAVLFLVLAGLLIVSRHSARQSILLIVAALVSAIWAFVFAWTTSGFVMSGIVTILLEFLRYAAWLAFLLSVLQVGRSDLATVPLKVLAYLGPAAILFAGLFIAGSPESAIQIFVLGSIALSILALVILERIYRNTQAASRRSIGYLSVAVAGLFGFDLFLFSSSVLFGDIDPGIHAARGVANAMIVPFLMIFVRQHREWNVEMFISRQVAYASLTMTAAGVYLVLMAVGGYYVREYGGSLGNAVAAILVFAAAIGLVSLLLSEKLRKRLRVFFSKHFFRNRYDYREEWRRLSQTLYAPANEQSLGTRSIEATAAIMGSVSGYLLLQRDGPTALILPHSAWQRELPELAMLSSDDGVVHFLEQSSWVIDTAQYREDREFYSGLELPQWLSRVDRQQLVVPLIQGSKLIGVMILDQSERVSLNYEDTDLLKIIGRQVAGLLAQELDAERVAEGKQFQAYSRLTAFLMHDLKNVAAQQSLIVKNAVVHRNNPEFVDDAFRTIELSVARINKLIAQLAERNRKERRKKVSATAVLADVVQQTSDRRPVPTLSGIEDEVFVLADSDKLSAIFTHLLRNAQDACDDGDAITVTVEQHGSDSVSFTVADTGKGMNDTFVREQLFKPFHSTKGVDGMGIGAYQAREYVAELGGGLSVASAQGEGTSMTVQLPVLKTESGPGEV